MKNYLQLPIDTEQLLFGSTIHNIIALFYEKLKTSNIEDLDRLWDDVYKECSNYVTNKDENRIAKIKQNFLAFERRRRENSGNDYLVEQRFEAEIQYNNHKIRIVGVIDFYDRQTKTLVDWKTGDTFLSEHKYVFQAHIYKLLLTKNNLDVNKIIFFNLDTGQHVPIPSVSEKFFNRKLNEILNSIKNNCFPARKCYLCKNCPYRIRCEFEGVSIWQIGL